MENTQKKAIAVNYSWQLERIDTEYGINDFAIIRDNCGKMHRLKIYYNTREGGEFINLYWRRIYVRDFLRLNF